MASAFLHRVRLSEASLAGDIRRIDLTSRFSGMVGMRVSVYVVDDLLVDAGFAHAREALLGALGARGVAAVCLTHHHEDHTAAAGALQRLHGCPVYLERPDLRETEGLDDLALYRRVWWGAPGDHAATAYPPEVVGARRRLRPIPTPGHSATHVALFEEATGTVFTGDLFVSTGASAVMRHEDPWTSVRSLRRVADLEPSLMLTGHGLAKERPAAALRRKADRVEEAAERVLELHRRGVGERAIVREVLPRNGGRDAWAAAMTEGEFSRVAFVRAVIREAPGKLAH